MKILVHGPESDDSFTHNVAHVLRRMGHDVRSGPTEILRMRKSKYRQVGEELLDRGVRRFRLRSAAAVVKIAEEFKPALTIFCTGTLEPESVEGIRRVSGGKAVCWYGDPPANLKRDHVTSGEYDAVFAKDRDFAARLRDVLGLEAYHLAEACNPDWHRPTAPRQGNDVLFAGACYGYRNALVCRLLDGGNDVRIYGPRPPAWVPRRVAAAHTGKFLDHTSKAAAFGRAMACVNNFNPSEGRWSVNCRVFETCGSGGLLLTERREAIEAYFEPGKEYLAFTEIGECLEHLDQMRRDYVEANQIRACAARRAHGEHTYEHRLREILRTLGMD